MNGTIAIHTARSAKTLLGRTVIKTFSFGLNIGQRMTAPHLVPHGVYREVWNASEWFWRASSAEKPGVIYNEQDIIDSLRLSYHFPARFESLIQPLKSYAPQTRV